MEDLLKVVEAAESGLDAGQCVVVKRVTLHKVAKVEEGGKALNDVQRQQSGKGR